MTKHIDNRSSKLLAVIDELFLLRAVDIESEPSDKRKQFLQKADRVNSNTAFHQILSQVSDEALKAASLTAKDMDEVYANRAIIFATARIKELFAHLSARFEEVKNDENASVQNRFDAH